MRIDRLEERLVFDAGCLATIGLADHSDGVNLYGVMTPGGLLTYDSSSARPGGAATNRNGPLVSAVLAGAGGHAYDYVRYVTRALRDSNVLYTSAYAYSSLAQVTVTTEQVQLSEVVPNTSVGTGAFDFEFVAEYFRESVSTTVPIASETVGGISTFEDRYNSPLGRGWKLENQEYLLEETDGDVAWLGSRGEVWFDFTPSPANYTTPKGIFGTLEKITDGSGTYFQFSEAWGAVQRFERAALTAGGTSGTKWLLVRATNASGNNTQYAYDDKNSDGVKDELVTMTDPYGRSVIYAYSAGLLQSMTDYAGRVTTFSHDAGGNKELIKITSPAVLNEIGASAQPETNFTYTTGSRLATVADPLNLTTSFAYGDATRLTGVTHADASARTLTAMYAMPLAATSASNQFLLMPPAMKTTAIHTTEVNERAHVIHSTTNRFCDETSRFVEPVYDAGGQLVGSLDYVFRQLDANGRFLSTTQKILTESSGGNLQTVVTQYTNTGPFNAFLSVQTFPDGSTKSYPSHNTIGKPTEIINELGYRELLAYDRGGNGPNVVYRRQVIGATDNPNNIVDDIVTTMVYTDGTGATAALPKGLLLSETDPLGRVTQYEYFVNASDPLTFGRLKKTTYPDDTPSTTDNPTTQVAYSITATSSLITTTDELGRVTQSTYDALDRLVQTESPDPDLIPGGTNGPLTSPVTTHRYDLAGNTKAMVDPKLHETKYDYDPRNRPIRTTSADPDGTGPLTSPVEETRYDAAGNKIADIDPLGRMTTFQIDAAGRTVATVSPDMDGLVSRPWLNPINRYDVNADGRVSGLDISEITRLDNARTDVTLGSAGDLPAIGKSQLPQAAGLLGAFYIDVNGDNKLTQADVDAINQYLANPASLPAGSDKPNYADKLGKPTILAVFDPSGNVIQSIDQEGGGTDFRYDVRGRQVTTIHPQVIDPNTWQMVRPITRRVVDAAGRGIAQIDALNRRTDYRFDELGRQIVMMLPELDGGDAKWQNDAFALDVNRDRIVSAADLTILANALTPAQHPEYNAYFDPVLLFPNLVQSGPDEGTANDYYDGQHLVDVDGNGQLTQADYDAVNAFLNTAPGTIANEILVFGRASRQTFHDKAGNVTFTVDAMGSVTERQYDARNRLRFVIEENPSVTAAKSVPGVSVNAITARATRPVTENQYDAAGQKVRAIDPLQRQTDYVFDQLGRMTEQRDPQIPNASGTLTQPTTINTYDANGNVTSVRDPLLNVTSMAYDNLDRLILETYPTVEGRRTSTINPPGNVTPTSSHEYNAAGEEVATMDMMGRRTARVYDDAGRLVRTDLPSSVTLGALTTNRFVSWTYDLKGSKLTESDPLGSVATPAYQKSWAYDTRGRAISETDQNGDTTSFVFDLNGNRVRLTDPNNNVTQWSFDPMDRTILESRAIGGASLTRVFSYDLVGAMITKRDRNGRVTRYEFDHLNRNVKEQWFANGTSTTALHTFTFTLDLGSNLDASLDTFHNYQFQQDGLDRTTLATQSITGFGQNVALTYGYNLTGQRTKLAGSIGTQNDFLTQIQYDALYRATQVTQSGQSGGNAVSSARVDLNYDKDGQIAWLFRYGSLTTTPAIATTRYLYDVAGRTDKIDHFRGFSNALSTKITGYDLNWDHADRLTAFLFTHAMFTAESTNAYSYDKRGQIIGADYAATSLVDEAYSYDHNGNRLTDHRGQTYSYATGYSQLTNDGKFQYLYDGEGNRTRKNKLDSSGNPITETYEEFVWDHRNRLTQVKEYVAGTLVESVTYAYDLFNQLVRRTVALTPVGGPSSTTERFFVLDRAPGKASGKATMSERVLSEAVSAPDDLGQIVLQLDSTSSGIQVSHRYLWGPGVDFQLADEQLPNTNGDGDTRVVWPMVDHLGTVRDLVEHVTFAAGGSRTILQKHRTYDSFGNILNEYNRGDFDGDGDFDATDVDMLFQFVAAGSFGNYNGVDINGDGSINSADIDAFIWDVIGTVYGDANLDGVCDASDLNVWNANKFQTGDFGWAQADFNGDNVVDTADWNIWNANKYTGVAGQLNTVVIEHIFSFTGRIYDEITTLQNNLNRWYSSAIGQWLNDDPLGFVDSEFNPRRYSNHSNNAADDPSGLLMVRPGLLKEYIPRAGNYQFLVTLDRSVHEKKKGLIIQAVHMVGWCYGRNYIPCGYNNDKYYWELIPSGTRYSAADHFHNNNRAVPSKGEFRVIGFAKFFADKDDKDVRKEVMRWSKQAVPEAAGWRATEDEPSFWGDVEQDTAVHSMDVFWDSHPVSPIPGNVFDLSVHTYPHWRGLQKVDLTSLQR